MSNASIQATSDALKKLASQLKDRRKANQALSVQLEGWVLRNFNSEGSLRQSEGWVQLSAATLLARLRKGRGSKSKKAAAKGLIKQGLSSAAVYAQSGAGLVKILQDTGALRQSFAGFYDADVAGVGAQSNATHGDLSIIHEYGDPSRNIPARPMLPTPDQALEMAMAVYERFVSESRQAANL